MFRDYRPSHYPPLPTHTPPLTGHCAPLLQHGDGSLSPARPGEGTVHPQELAPRLQGNLLDGGLLHGGLLHGYRGLL